MRKTAYIPPIVMLFAGLTACIVTIINKYEELEILLILLCTLIIFYVIGIIIKVIADKCLTVKEKIELLPEEINDDEEVSDK